jgi:CRISPR-associated protein Csy2
MKTYLLIPKIEIHNANAMSSSITLGFPAMTAWLGAMHALQRRLQQDGWSQVTLRKLGISCHECDVQTYCGPGDYKKSIIGTANPLRRKNKDFVRPPFIEEARCHLKVSLLIELAGLGGEDTDAFTMAVQKQLYQMKMAGGDICSFRQPSVQFIDEGEESAVRMIMRRLMPGFVVIERRDVLQSAMDNGQDALAALLSFLTVRYTAETDEKGDISAWIGKKNSLGWMVPLAVGFKDISGAVTVKNQRDPACEHHFAEAMLTLGEFKMAHRFSDIDDIMWEYQVDPTCGLYICRNQAHSITY